MESQAFDHNLHQNDANSLYSDVANAHDLHSQNLDINQGDHFNNDLHNNNYDINHNQNDYYQNHGLNNDQYQNHGLDYHNNHGNQADQNQFISDYEQPNFSQTISEISAGNYSPSFHPDQFLAHDTQRLGSANFTPSSPSDISENKEVTFKDADGNEQSGTVKKTNDNDTYTI